jgi:hypothetical protein
MSLLSLLSYFQLPQILVYLFTFIEMKKYDLKLVVFDFFEFSISDILVNQHKTHP